MCGIVGEYFFNQNQSNHNIEILLEKVMKRGPDFSDIFTSDCIALGHSRLSIIDLSEESNQPFVDKEAKMVIVYNGCIFNYLDLKDQLSKKGYIFKTTGDTEVIIKSYQEWGYDCLKKFEGDFAFAIWEEECKKLFLARDRFGIKPLYFSNNTNYFRFGSNIQSIISKKDVDLIVDPMAMHLHFSLHSVVPAPNTIFKNIKKVPPGHYLVIDKNNKLKVNAYWNLDNCSHQDLITNENTAVEIINEKLIKAIRKRLYAADTDVGVLLSGGLDSSLIVALANYDGFHDLKTYSIGFEDDLKEKGSEFFYSDQIAKKYKTNHKKFVINNKSVLARLPETFKSMSEPMVAQDAVAFYLLSELVSKDVKVVLSGQGADEGFAGYFWYKKMSSELNNYRNFSKHYFDRSHEEIEDLLNIKFKEDYSSKMIKKTFKNINSQTLLGNVLNFDISTLVVDDPVKRVDNMTMAWGLEARVPFLDHELIEASVRIDPKLHIKRNGKNILKSVSDNILPKDVIDRQKGYFPMPALKYIRGEYYEFVCDVLNSSSCYNRNLYNRKHIQSLLDKPNEYKTAIEGNKLWHVAATELWFQQNID